MPYVPGEWEKRLDERLRSRWPVALMNDTKWREVWLVLADLRCRFHLELAHQEAWNLYHRDRLLGPFRPEDVWERGVRDNGFVGPLLFKQLLSVRVPEKAVPADVRYPVVRNDLGELRRRLSALGELPVGEAEGCLEVRGYGYHARSRVRHSDEGRDSV